jgi:Fe-Mn family superoxide dismutase
MNDDTIERRAFGAGVAATVAAAALLQAEDAEGQPRPRPQLPELAAAPPEKPLVPLPFPAGALQGLSERLLRSHHENNYGGAVRKLNEIRRNLAAADPDQAGGYWSLYGSLKAAELAARNSALLHERYFANLAPPPAGDAGVATPAALGRLLAARFGSLDRFQAQFRGAAKASNGWIVLVTDPVSRTLEVVQTEGHAFGAWEAAPLLVLDVFEHAYAIDFGADKNAYFSAFWRNVRWAEVERRTTLALGRL